MYRFSEVTYDEATENVVVGAGNVWDNVYATLEPLGDFPALPFFGATCADTDRTG